MTDARIALVGAGYDVIGESFVEWRDRIAGDPRRWWTEQLTSRLPGGARVLELGCGSGAPDTQDLAASFHVTGVDISPAQVTRARENVPSAEFIQADFTQLDLAPGSFDAVAAFYSFNHVPRELLAGLLAKIYSWLAPSGLLLTSFATSDTESWTGEWLGTQMFFSSYLPETNRRLLEEAGFEVLLDELVTTVEPEPDGEGQWQWVLARR